MEKWRRRRKEKVEVGKWKSLEKKLKREKVGGRKASGKICKEKTMYIVWGKKSGEKEEKEAKKGKVEEEKLKRGKYYNSSRWTENKWKNTKRENGVCCVDSEGGEQEDGEVEEGKDV